MIQVIGLYLLEVSVATFCRFQFGQTDHGPHFEGIEAYQRNGVIPANNSMYCASVGHIVQGVLGRCACPNPSRLPKSMHRTKPGLAVAGASRRDQVRFFCDDQSSKSLAQLGSIHAVVHLPMAIGTKCRRVFRRVGPAF